MTRNHGASSTHSNVQAGTQAEAIAGAAVETTLRPQADPGSERPSQREHEDHS